MLINDLFEETFFAVSANKARSGLTVLGIVIGIGSVIAMISIGQGTQVSISQSIQSLGSNLLMIMPGAQRGVGSQVSQGMGSAASLTIQDAEDIENKILFVDSVASVASTRKQVTAKGENTNTSIYGVDAVYAEVKNIEIEVGSFISDQQSKKMSKVAVLGPTTRDDLFGDDVNPVGQKIKIESQEFTVIGVTKEQGGSGMMSSDDIVYIPLATVQHYLTGSDSLTTINVQVTEEKMMDIVEEQITALLLSNHGIKDVESADFYIMNQADLMETMSSVSDTLTLLLGSIAGISLIVGGIGIMNMMLTTVTERTREIGLRKSLGAKSRDISVQFLAESALLTLIGGVVGVILGALASFLIGKFGGMTTYVAAWSVWLAFGVSGSIGIIFGYYPAKRAAMLNPIEALRYE